MPHGAAASFCYCVVASLLVAAGLFQVHRAKSQGLDEVEAGLSAKRLLNLNELGAREELIPALTPFFPKSRERDAAARDIYYLTGSLSNVGGIAQRKLLTGEQFRQLKPLLVVRRPAQFQRAFYLWCGIFLGAFWLVHLYWSLRGFRGDQTVSAGAAGAQRHRADPDGEPARSGARQHAVRGFRAGRGGRRGAAGCAQRVQLRTAHRQVEFRAAAGQLRALRAAGAVRFRSRRQRRQGEPVRLPTGGDHPRAAGVLPGGILRAMLGCAAARAREPARRWPR